MVLNPLSSITPMESYEEECRKGVIFSDPQQLDAMQHLQRVYFDLINEHKRRDNFLSFLHSPRLVQGIYLWGGVGVGKTFMMDCFYKCLPFPQKMRMHFHQFMRLIHDELTRYQGEKDPLQLVAKKISQQAMLLCFDELFVSDITDAMLLGRLFKALFSRGVCLVTTSNVAPDELYKNGLQREQFLPAIDMIKANTDVIHVPTVIDYRLRHLKEAGVFYTPLNDASRESMEKTFEALAGDAQVSTAPIILNDREIRIKKKTDKIIWFEFEDICKVPRSQNDYLTLSKLYHTVFISDIPVIAANAKDTICLFVSLVDVLYDARVRLVISAAEPVEKLYNRGYMILEYTRTHSRLLEMQSTDYFLDQL